MGIRRRIALGSAIAATSVAGALFVPGLASAHDKDPAKAQAAKECLANAGVTKPAKGVKPTPEQRDAVRAALAACGIERPAKGTRGDGSTKPHGKRGPRASAPTTAPSTGA